MGIGCGWAPVSCELSFGTYKAPQIEAGRDYYGFWTFKNQRGAGSTTKVKLYGQEGKYGRGNWRNLHCILVRAENHMVCSRVRQQASMLESGVPPGHTGPLVTLPTRGHKLRDDLLVRSKKRPGLSYLLLGLVFVIGVNQVVLAGTDFLPGRYDWILGSLLFGTTLAWMGAAALAGVVAPVSNIVMKYAYGALLIFLLAFVASMTAYVVLYPIPEVKPDWLSPFSLPMGLAIWAWMTLAGFIGSLAPRCISARAYIPLVICPLITGIGVTGLLLMLPGRECPCRTNPSGSHYSDCTDW